MSDELKPGPQTSPAARLALRTLAGALAGLGVGISIDAKNGAPLAHPELLGFVVAGALGVLIAELLDFMTQPTTKDDLFRDP